MKQHKAEIATNLLFTDEQCLRKKRIYLYPITPYMYKEGSNNYILRLKDHLGEEFNVVNEVTRLGLFDVLLKLPKTDIIYFNWIADLPDRKLGYIQIPVLALILVICRIFRKKIVWFVHNDVSHKRKNWLAKNMIRIMMMRFANVVLAHSNELSLAKKMPAVKVFDHPVDFVETKESECNQTFDLLIWGSVSPYKGVLEFLEYNSNTDKLNHFKILVAGKFASEKLYNKACSFQKDNLVITNQAPTDEELEELFKRSKYILFCYRSSSVLGSAALCKSLSFGKTVIGPNIGAFKELGQKGLIYTYNTFDDLPELVHHLKLANLQISKDRIREYTEKTSWKEFQKFLIENLKDETYNTRQLNSAS